MNKIKVTKIEVVTAEKLEEMLKDAETFEQVHFGPMDNILKPRGSMQKNSIGEYMFEKLLSTFEHWTDSKFADNPPVDELIEVICTNFRDECTAALKEFFDNEQVRKELSKTYPVLPK